MSWRSFCRGAFLLTTVAAFAPAQTQQQFPFQLLVTSGNNSGIVQNGATITFSTPIGQSDSANVLAIYRGTGRASITQIPQVLGSTAFDVGILGKPPFDLGPGDSVSFNVFYRPTNTSQSTAQVSLAFVETIPANPQNPNQPTVLPNVITLVLQGTVPSFALSYSLQSDMNVIPLQPGDSIMFPATLINTTATAALLITNRGNGPGLVTNISISGSSAFRLVGVPLLPLSIPSGQSLQVSVTYKPTAVVSDTGQIQVSFGVNSTVTVGIQGSGTSSTFLYEVLQGSTPTPVMPGGSVTIPDTNVGDTSSVTIRVRNTGNANGIINSISLVGQGFQLGGVPNMLPITITPNNSLTFTVTFAPTQAVTSTAHVSIGGDSFDLVGRGLGPKLVFSYSSGGTTVTVGANGSVFFSPTTISQITAVDFVVSNTGTQVATISSIGVGEPKSPYSVSALPALPLSLDPGAETSFTINFAPTTTGFSNGTLRIDSAVIGLSGSGTTPPPLPGFNLQGPTGNVDPLSQPTVRLNLASPYPIAVAGTLTLTVSGDLPSDPAVQFLTGGRTVAFVIPANTTDAIFAGQGPQIRLQTGTVASTITLTPSFSTQDGGIDLTPNRPATLQFAVASGAPVLIAAQPSSETTNSLVLNVSGYTTTRSVTTLNVQFTAAQGFNVTTTQFTIDLRQVSALFFQSSASQAFGGQFSVAMPFSFQGTAPTGQTVLSSISSISVTVSNERGVSNSVQTKP